MTETNDFEDVLAKGDYMEMLDRWMELDASIKHLKEQEKALRVLLFEGTFPEPEEGTNNHELPDGRIVKGVYRINRRVDQDEAQSLPAKIRKKYFRTKLELNKREYNDAEDEERAIVERVITATPGTPSLDVKAPK